jgi:hypothetical protein
VSIDERSATIWGGFDAGSDVELLHCISCPSARSMSIASAAKGARYASARIRMTTSAATSAGSSRVLESSRKRRLTWFRATAEWRYRGTISPIRVRDPGKCARGEAMARTSRKVVRIRFPSCAIRCSSAPRVMRARRGKPSDARGASGSGVLVRDADRQLLPSLLPAASQGLPTPLRFHTRTKSVRLEAPRVARTVGWLSHGDSKCDGLSKLTAQTGKASFRLEIGQAT